MIYTTRMDDVINPYQPLSDDDSTPAPFAGRQAAFARLHQYLEEPTSHHALAFLGQHRGGKTALLRRFDTVYDPTFMGVHFPLRQSKHASEAELWTALVRASERTLAERDLTLTRLPMLPDSNDNLRDWLDQNWLPEVWTAIRPHRRLVWLLDDGHLLIDRLPPSVFASLHDLLNRHPQLKIVLTASLEDETSLPTMDPLVDLAQVFRLTHLSQDETAWLLQEPAKPLYTVSDSAAHEVYRATGGQPQLTQRFGYHIYNTWESDPSHTTITLEDVKALLHTMMQESRSDFLDLWQQSTPVERRVLTALSRLIYTDPLNPVDHQALMAWMIDSDNPLDSAAVNAGLRSLDYREIVRQEQGKITLTMGLMQLWLLDTTPMESQPAPDSTSRRRQLALVLLLVLLIVALLAISQLSGPEVAATPALPTATLAGG
ncbi:MAG: ATP-binding protein [Anaerolineae bacterium]|nr:ATP-binding protein [Anaerolineae bacterium]